MKTDEYALAARSFEGMTERKSGRVIQKDGRKEGREGRDGVGGLSLSLTHHLHAQE